MPVNTSAKHIVIDARIRRSSTGRYVDRLLEHLQDIDTTTNYTVLLQPDDPWEPKSPNFVTRTCPFAQFSLNPLDQIRFARMLYGLRADLVHFPMNQQPLFYFGPVVTTTMDFTFLRFPRRQNDSKPVFWIKMAGYRFLFWYSNKKSKHILTITNYVKNELESTYKFTKGKITNTYCAAEPALASKAEQPKGVVKNDKFLFAVGTAFPHKNLQNLVLAHKLLQKKYPDLKLYMAGKKEYYYQELDTFIEQNTNTNMVRTLGFITDAELKWMYEHASVYVFPSFSEGFGLPALEAMVHGVPVASSNATCLPEVCGNAALYFDPHSPADMAKKIDQLLTDSKLRESMVQKGHKQVAKFSWRHMAQETLVVYKNALY
jgi:glycosyltransferase involved in cell wall biosynthesis